MRRPQAFAQAADFNGEIASVGNLHLQRRFILLIEQLVHGLDQRMIVRCGKVNDAPWLSLPCLNLGTGNVDVDYFFLFGFVEIAPNVNACYELGRSATAQGGREQRCAIFARRAALA